MSARVTSEASKWPATSFSLCFHVSLRDLAKPSIPGKPFLQNGKKKPGKIFQLEKNKDTTSTIKIGEQKGQMKPQQDHGPSSPVITNRQKPQCPLWRGGGFARTLSYRLSSLRSMYRYIDISFQPKGPLVGGGVHLW